MENLQKYITEKPAIDDATRVFLVLPDMDDNEGRIHDEMVEQDRAYRDPLWSFTNWDNSQRLIRFIQFLGGIAVLVYSWWLYKKYDPTYRSWWEPISH